MVLGSRPLSGCGRGRLANWLGPLQAGEDACGKTEGFDGLADPAGNPQGVSKKRGAPRGWNERHRVVEAITEKWIVRYLREETFRGVVDDTNLPYMADLLHFIGDVTRGG